MSLFDTAESDGQSSISIGLNNRAIQQLSYDATYSDRRTAQQGASCPITVSVQYSGDSLDSEEIEKAENLLAGRLYQNVGPQYFD